MDEFSLLEHFSEQPSERVGGELGAPCGLGDATSIDGARAADLEGAGLIVEVDGQLYDLGDEDGSVTLADDDGLSIYSDLDGDGTVDHVTTVRFDGTWESWISDDVDEGEDGVDLAGSPELPESLGSVNDWDAYSWERSSRGSWR